MATPLLIGTGESGQRLSTALGELIALAIKQDEVRALVLCADVFAAMKELNEKSHTDS